MEPIRLWGCADDPYFVRSEPSPHGEGYHEYAALPRSEYDALKARLDRAEADQRMLHQLQAAAKHPGNADMLRAIRDLGCNEPAGDPVKVVFMPAHVRVPSLADAMWRDAAKKTDGP